MTEGRRIEVVILQHVDRQPAPNFQDVPPIMAGSIEKEEPQNGAVLRQQSQRTGMHAGAQSRPFDLWQDSSQSSS